MAKFQANQVRTAAELNQLVKKQFETLQLPAHWKLEGFNTFKNDDDTQEIVSVGAIYLDTHTHGIDVKRYRIFFHTYTEKLGLVEKKVLDFGKWAYSCLCSNKSVEQMNDYIKTLQHEST